MANVNITFNGKNYLLSCDDGQEENLKKLAKSLDLKFENLKSDLGNLGENKLLLITAIKIIDEFFDIKKKVSKTKGDFENLSEKFKELKSLAINYKDTKEQEIENLKKEINDYKVLAEENKSSYEKLLDKTTDSINQFIDETQTDKNVQ